MQRSFLLTVITSVILLFTGCVGYIPSFSKEPISGKKITPRDADFVIPGKTTRAEVIRKLGTQCRAPSRVSAMGYGWEMPTGTAFWIVFSAYHGAAGSHEFSHRHALFLEFDARSIVTRKEFLKLKNKLTLDEQLETWAGLNR